MPAILNCLWFTNRHGFGKNITIGVGVGVFFGGSQFGSGVASILAFKIERTGAKSDAGIAVFLNYADNGVGAGKITEFFERSGDFLIIFSLVGF